MAEGCQHKNRQVGGTLGFWCQDCESTVPQTEEVLLLGGAVDQIVSAANVRHDEGALPPGKGATDE